MLHMGFLAGRIQCGGSLKADRSWGHLAVHMFVDQGSLRQLQNKELLADLGVSSLVVLEDMFLVGLVAPGLGKKMYAVEVEGIADIVTETCTVAADAGSWEDIDYSQLLVAEADMKNYVASHTRE